MTESRERHLRRAILLVFLAAPLLGGVLSFVEVLRDDVSGVEGLAGVSGLALDPSGDHLYAVAETDSALVVFSRDETSGKLTFLELFQDDVDGVFGLVGASGVAASPDGRNVFVTAATDATLAVFRPDSMADGLVFVAAAVKENGIDGVTGLDGACAVTVSPDDEQVFVASGLADSLVVFSRDATTDDLAFVERESDGAGGVDGLAGACAVAVSPDSKHVYVASGVDDAVAAFERVGGAVDFVGMLQDGVGGVDGLDGASGVVVSPDGLHVYVTGAVDDAVAAFDRDDVTGVLTFQTVYRDGIGGVSGIRGASALHLSAAGDLLLVAGRDDNAIALFQRLTPSGALVPLDAAFDGVGGMDGLAGVAAVLIGGSGDHAYAAGHDEDAVAHFNLQSLGGRVWFDVDFDGLQDAGEPGISGVRVNLHESGGGFLGFTETDGNGDYRFPVLPGTFYLEFELPAAYQFVAADQGSDDALDSDADPGTGQTVDIVVAPVSGDDSWDAGLANGIGDRVWRDLDGDGFQDGSEPGVGGVVVSLRANGGAEVAATVTAADGSYSFVDVAPGSYYLQLTAPTGFVFTPPNQGADDALDSDADPVNGDTQLFAFATGDLQRQWDAGLVTAPPTTGQVGDRVWLDLDQDGKQDGGEPGVPGVELRLWQVPDPPRQGRGAQQATTFTDQNGYYSFVEEAGTYYLEIVTDSPLVPQDQGADDTIDSDFDPVGHTTAQFALVAASVDGSRDAGIDPDRDDDGTFDDVDNCPTDPNPDQADADGDGVGTLCDNCPLVANPSQGDSDDDGLGDHCDLDTFIFLDGFESGDLTGWDTTSP